MKRHILILLALVIAALLSTAIPAAPTLAENDPINVSTNHIWMDFPAGGTCTADITVQNASAVPITVNASPWPNYVYPERDAQWIDPSWFTRVFPDTQTLQPGEKMIINLELSIPPEAPEIKYQTWLHLNVGEWDKPITITIRKGSAIPTYDYGISPSFYAMLAYGPGARIEVDPTHPEAGPISITSNCSANTIFMLTPEPGATDFTVTSEQINSKDEKGNYRSAMFGGHPEYLDTFWHGLSENETATWFSSPANFSNPARVRPYSTQTINWTLSIPEDAPDGNYWFWIRISPAEPNPAMIGEEYLVKFFVTVERQPSTLSALLLSLTGIGIICIIALCAYIAYRLLSLIKNHRRPTAKQPIRNGNKARNGKERSRA